ncbi:MAG: anthranilate phosphoribosyltransferase [Microbacteriaceae bacterium]
MDSGNTWPNLLTQLLDLQDLSISQAAWAMEQILNGQVSDASLAAFLVALRAKGEAVHEIIGFRDSILEAANDLEISSMALDIVGTGGDMVGTFNISSTASIICAAAGVPVIKHGNRAFSSQSGSSDILSELGVNLKLSAEDLARVFEACGITFVFAGLFHQGFRHASNVRKDLGIPTVFNFLGPLSNPARPEASAVGVSSIEKAPLIAGVFQTRGAAALVFRGDDGLDEITTTGHSHIWEVSGGLIREHDFDPRDLGIKRARLDDLLGGSPQENAAQLKRLFAGEQGAVRDIVLLNAAGGLTAYELAQNPESFETNFVDRMKHNYARATQALDSGAAAKKLEDWIRVSNAAEASEH